MYEVIPGDEVLSRAPASLPGPTDLYQPTPLDQWGMEERGGKYYLPTYSTPLLLLLLHISLDYLMQTGQPGGEKSTNCKAAKTIFYYKRNDCVSSPSVCLTNFRKCMYFFIDEICTWEEVKGGPGSNIFSPQPQTNGPTNLFPPFPPPPLPPLPR